MGRARKWNPWKLRSIALQLLEHFGTKPFRFTDAKKVVPELTRYAFRRMYELNYFWREKRGYYTISLLRFYWRLDEDKVRERLFRELCKWPVKHIAIVEEKAAIARGLSRNTAGFVEPSLYVFGMCKIRLVKGKYNIETLIHETAHAFVFAKGYRRDFRLVFKKLSENLKERIRREIKDYALKNADEFAAEILTYYILYRWTKKEKYRIGYDVLNSFGLLKIAKEFEEWWAPHKILAMRAFWWYL
ncbi:MAG: hypothetical protein ACTSX9_03935 [Candidatus Njordarchaeales archaeon]